MTTSHLFYYLLVVLIITSLAYVYTSQVEAPHIYDDKADNDKVEDVKDNYPVPATPSDSNDPADPADSADVEESIDSYQSPLQGSSWIWDGIIDKDGKTTFTPRRPEAYMLQFTDTRISSRTDCNTIGGIYRVEGQTIVISEMMSTLMYCEDSDETIYSSSLSTVSTYKEVDDNLYLIMEDGTSLLFTSRIPN
jgi:heat shock protein HslJ